MVNIKRNQVVISALVVMIGVAGYLNYMDASDKGSTMVLSDNLEFVDLNAISSYDNPQITVTEDVVTVTAGEEKPDDVVTITAEAEKPGDAIFVNSSADTSYFVQAKLDREQVRAKEKDALMEMVNSPSTPEEKKSEAADGVLELQQRIEKESAAEAMIESKGFNGVYVRIDDDTVDVVVNKAELTDQEIAQIQDIVSRKTGLSPDKIRINTIKK